MATTGGVRLQKMIRDGKICEPFLWVDCYNQSTLQGIVGTIMTRIDASNHYAVTTPPQL